MPLLHLPSYNLGRQLATFDRAAGQIKEDEVLLESLITFPDSIEGFDTHGGLPLFPLSMLEGYRTEMARPRKVWWVHQHSVRLEYGGPEEGGWWYTAGNPTSNPPRGPFHAEKEANDLCRLLNEEERDRAAKSEPYEFTSVLAHHSNHYSYSVSTDRDSKPFPETAPHYE